MFIFVQPKIDITAVVESSGELVEAGKNLTILTDFMGILPVVNGNRKREIHRKCVYTSTMFLTLPLYPFKDKGLPCRYLASSKNEDLILVH